MPSDDDYMRMARESLERGKRPQPKVAKRQQGQVLPPTPPQQSPPPQQPPWPPQQPMYYQQPQQPRWYQPDANFDNDLKRWVMGRVVGFVLFWCVIGGIAVVFGLMKQCGIG